MPRLLHGTLNVTIISIDKLRTGFRCNFLGKTTSPRSSGRKSLISRVKTMVRGQPQIESIYATVDLGRARAARTSSIKMESSNPIWNEDFRIYCAHYISEIIFTIKGTDPVGATLIGRAYVPVEDVFKGYIFEKEVDIVDESRKRISGSPTIRVKIHFSDVTKDSHWSRGISSPDFEGVPNTYFTQRKGCNVTLYQDAHVADNFRPQIGLSDGYRYELHRCWQDIYDGITNARHLIYITGWSVYKEITLVRDPEGLRTRNDLKLGELLKRKAEEPGMTVLVLVWDDQTSQETKKDGLMATHDQETADYFRNTKVQCVLCPRKTGKGRSIAQGISYDVVFTHHQKLVVVDAELNDVQAENKRTIVSFIGGIDLCDGRYDTQDHPLFKTLDSAHKDDFHQPNFPGASIKKGGPREPWHDIHCRLEGPIAWDVLYNFEQRWRKQADEKYLIPMTTLDNILVRPSSMSSSRSLDSWNVQLFRSIDSGAASGFPQAPNTAVAFGLVNERGNIVDRSIQDAYIQAIRRAKNFIYIENQYFLGSSFDWKRAKDFTVEDVNALHLIPKELSLKIVNKIEAGERFSVYVVIPMWPEGVPESAAVQAILDWQRRTMEMMYADISKAIQRKGLPESTHPRDYLTFFCLGNRESDIGSYKPEVKPEADSDYSRAQQMRRFMIYVHSKMLIVDDEYIIIGSANINQRSMDGARDTEIAMGAYQPHHLTITEPVRGQVYGLRMALWYEHLRQSNCQFEFPESLECIRRVNALAKENWRYYADNNSFTGDLLGHLLQYPIEVSQLGDVMTAEENKNFPDTKAPVLGTRSDYLPYILTT